MSILISLISLALNIYTFIIVLHVAVTWLVVFKVLDIENPQAYNLVQLLKKATDPVIKPIQKYVPPIGGIDLTPIVALIGLQVIARIIIGLLAEIAY